MPSASSPLGINRRRDAQAPPTIRPGRRAAIVARIRLSHRSSQRKSQGLAPREERYRHNFARAADSPLARSRLTRWRTP